MPPTKILYYKDANGRSPVFEWLIRLREREEAAFEKCMRSIRVLASNGHELRRPHSDYLRDGIYELRVRCGRINYRLLYFFHGQNVVVVAEALSKEDRVPAHGIERAIDRRREFKLDPAAHTENGEPFYAQD